MKLHENEELFRQAVQATAQRMDISDIYIEKDYWVCYALKLIYESAIKNEVIFKGGTVLSKCYTYIDRFSEDIDLVVLRREEETGNQLKNKLKKITREITAPFTEVAMEGITNKLGMIRKIAYNYPKIFKGTYGQVRDVIIIEATWLGYFEPYSKRVLNTYIFDMMMATNQTSIAEEYALLPFEALVLDSRRTFCEKIMSLVRFSHTKTPIVDLNAKIRHIYDIHQLLKDDTIQAFFSSDVFDSMLLKVAHDDVQSFKNNNDWLQYHPKEALIFKKPEETWNKLKDTYQNDFKFLVYGELPNEEDILMTIMKVGERLRTITWIVTF
ncbi:nucleotidyltransferase AbiEii toxin of type IV toxin-antitoxin system [Maribacter spongiicola]|uniref:Nucleotidyltransferase AbiEii toxin of type IV toxin-antitoxin system n=1 Tax=Maribacter spongiicola TaxID=1206753 RepID=A0A4R7K9M7_9FLAO|nr:nucleotidyl transferase AbiEii/AbiGii toxin family protein [Maribacter spongiicola]TDT46694.1 nucleotidyltransferase AbiEii toxin of type IV toxin-antitoxin system [Maribacter spongiicola]